MDDNFPVLGMKTNDVTEYQLDGTTARFRQYRFYLGKHGPFTEKVPLDPFDEYAIQRLVDQLRAHLRALPT